MDNVLTERDSHEKSKQVSQRKSFLMVTALECLIVLILFKNKIRTNKRIITRASEWLIYLSKG